MPSIEERLTKIERLLRVGGLGDDDLRAAVDQHTALLGSLIGDRTLGGALTGALPESISSMSLRRAGPRVYLAGSLNGTIATAITLLFNNKLVALPLYVPSYPNIVSSIGIEVTTGSGIPGDVARLGIYADGRNLYPGRLIVDVGTVPTDTAGFKAITLREALPRGLSWVTVVLNAVATLRALATNATAGGSGAWAVLGHNQADLTLEYIGWIVDQAYGALPMQYPSGGAEAGLLPIVYLSFSES